MIVAAKILGFIACALLFSFFMLGIIITIQYLSWFHGRRCKHCHKIMEYKGLKENSDESHYLFHCPKCGAWEQVPKEYFNSPEP